MNEVIEFPNDLYIRIEERFSAVTVKSARDGHVIRTLAGDFATGYLKSHAGQGGPARFSAIIDGAAVPAYRTDAGLVVME